MSKDKPQATAAPAKTDAAAGAADAKKAPAAKKAGGKK